MKHKNTSENEEHMDKISISRSCEHFSVEVNVTGDMDGDMQRDVIGRVARALVLVMEGRDPGQGPAGHGELVGSVILESPTDETIKSAFEQMMNQAMEHIKEHQHQHEQDEADGKHAD